MKFAYSGPSWAASSYPIDTKCTNLAKEWNLSYIDYSKPGSTVLDCVAKLEAGPDLPIVWIYHEPLGCLFEATGLSREQLMQRTDWKDIWEECNQFCLDKIASLNRPVLLIGGHSDIINCDHSNIIVGDPSWQKFLAHRAGMTIEDNNIYVKMDDGGDFTLNRCWGAELIHRFMHEHPNITPTIEITNSVWDIFFFWKELEKLGLFYEVHPNRRGNELFAEFLKPTLVKFLQEIQ